LFEENECLVVHLLDPEYLMEQKSFFLFTKSRIFSIVLFFGVIYLLRRSAPKLQVQLHFLENFLLSIILPGRAGVPN
jgi:hypothetical protein